jgi:hypothetical protein
MEPITVLSEEQLRKHTTVDSKVFSIYATGYVRAGKRETRVRIHSVVDFRGAPPPGAGQMRNVPGQPPSSQAGQPGGQGGSSSGTAPTAQVDPNAINAMLEPSPAGNVIHHKVY